MPERSFDGIQAEGNPQQKRGTNGDRVATGVTVLCTLGFILACAAFDGEWCEPQGMGHAARVRGVV
jgi:hypothetical protein